MFGLVGCSHGASSSSEAGATGPSGSGSASAGAASSGAPAPGASGAAPAALPEGRCADDAHGEITAADGSKTAVACGADSVCLGGACAPLAIPAGLGGGAVARETVLKFVGAGFAGAWSQLGPFDRGQVDSFAKSPRSVLDNAQNGGVRALCAPGGRVDVKPRGGGHALLAGFLVSARAQRIWVKAGVAGKARVWVGADKLEKVIDVARTQGLDAIPDDAAEAAQLAAGPNLVLVDLEGTDDGPPSLWFRVQGEKGPATDVGFAPASAKGACSIESLVALTARRTVTDDGLDLDFAASLRGLAPLVPAKVPYRVELRAKKPVTVVEGELATGDLEAAGAKARGTAGETESPKAGGDGPAPAHFAAHVAPQKDGKQTVRVALGGGESKEERLFGMHLRKKLFPRVAALVKAAAALPESAPLGSRESFARDVEDIARATSEGHPDEAWITARVEGAESLAAGFAKGEDPYRERAGVVFRAYRSELDGQLQPYVAFIPKQHKAGGSGLPMIVSYHGLTHKEEHALRAVIGEATQEDQNPDYAARHLPGFPSQGAILVAPWGYGKSGPRQLGEHDILRVVDEMKRAYSVDATRVSITGYSLGGTVAFALPLHYPSVFSAAAPLCGYPNLTTYNSVKDVPHAEWEEAMIARRFLGNYAGNGLHVPMHIVHGGQDGPGRSKVIADRYSALGYPRIFDVQDDLGHNVWDYAYKDGRMVTWLKKKQQPKPPSRVRLVTGEYRYDTAHWVRLIGMQASPGTGGKIDKADSPESFADIDAQMDFPAKELRIATRNVQSFAVDLAALGAPKGTVAKIDGAAVPTDGADKVAFFERGEQGWSLSVTEPSRVGKKRAGVSGPLDDVLRHAQLIVYGTQDPAQTEANRVTAEWFSSADQWASARFPIKADRDVTDAELTGRSLVLIGGPSSNRVTGLFAADLPIKIEGNAIVARGKRHEGEDLGVSFIAPHPRDAKEYVVVHAGTTFRGTLASRSLPQLAPDYLVYDRRITVMRGELLLDKRQVVAGGFFDEGWK